MRLQLEHIDITAPGSRLAPPASPVWINRRLKWSESCFIMVPLYSHYPGRQAETTPARLLSPQYSTVVCEGGVLAVLTVAAGRAEDIPSGQFPLRPGLH